MNARQEQFVTEARELIRQATDDLIVLERDGRSPERIDRAFRAFHTLKGSAGIVELPAMGIALHAAEDLLAAVRQGTLEVNAGIIDQTLATLDQISLWVDDFENGGALPAQAGDDGRALAERLRSFLPGAQRRETMSAAKSVQSPREATLPVWASRLMAAERDAIASIQARPAVVYAIAYEPSVGCFFNGDDPLQLMRRVPDVLAIHIEPREPFAPLADLDPYACNLRLLAISAGSHDEIARIFRLVPDQVRITVIPFDALPKDALIRKVIEAQAELLGVTHRADDFDGCVGSVARAATNALRHGDYLQLADAMDRAGASALSQRDTRPLLAALEQALVAFDDARRPAVAEDVDEPNLTSADATQRPADRVLRVSEAKIEALVNLAGELVVAKNSLAHSAKRVDVSKRASTE